MASSAESALFDRLSNDATVNAITGAPPNARVYPVESPQVGGTYPLITYQRISGMHIRSLAGSSGAADGRFQINCSDRTQAGAVALFDAVRDCLDGFKGIMGTVGSGNEIYVGRCILDGEGDLPDLSPQSESQRVYTRYMDFKIWYEEIKPTLA